MNRVPDHLGSVETPNYVPGVSSGRSESGGRGGQPPGPPVIPPSGADFDRCSTPKKPVGDRWFKKLGAVVMILYFAPGAALTAANLLTSFHCAMVRCSESKPADATPGDPNKSGDPNNKH